MTVGSSPHARGARGRADPRHWRRRLIPACAGSTHPFPAHWVTVKAHPRMRGEHARSPLTACPWRGSSPHARGARQRPEADHGLLRLIPACAGSTSGLTPMTFAIVGSSPHARGALGLQQRLDLGVGLIPACAGSTRWCPAGRRGSRAHPRMRGEHRSVSWIHTSPAGSSPHARGARVRWCCHDRRAGLIPACAGSTSSAGAVVSGAWAHPRMRGEHHFPSASRDSGPGSSPHARGALLGADSLPWCFRLIPACAGSTSPAPEPTADPGAHPRMRGEHSEFEAEDLAAFGSSPHARGAPRRRCRRLLHGGLIPACAGSTSSRSGTPIPASGSSPHARGARRVVGVGGRRRGLIPACAGSTQPRERKTSAVTAHPRMRGEHACSEAVLASCNGSSPHARGAPDLKLLDRVAHRLIPACAGSTAAPTLT